MTDLLLQLGDGRADLAIVGGDLALDETLRTPLIAAVHTDRRADVDQVAEGQSRRGWWADSAGEEWGSLLWILSRRALTSAVLEDARQYVEQSLRHLIDAGVVEGVRAIAEAAAGGQLSLRVELTRGAATSWPQLWEATADMEIEAPGVRLRILTL